MSLTFREPVIARVHGRNGEPTFLEIASVRDGLTALNRCGLGREQHGSPEWQRAVDRLVKAALDPSSACVEDARQALLTLVGGPCQANNKAGVGK